MRALGAPASGTARPQAVALGLRPGASRAPLRVAAPRARRVASRPSSPVQVARAAGEAAVAANTGSSTTPPTSRATPVTDESWQATVLDSETPVLVDFWAPWCGPCRMIAPVVDELATEFRGRLNVCKLNTDESPSIATQYGIRSIPTVVLFKDGQKVDAVIGAAPKANLVQVIERHL